MTKEAALVIMAKQPIVGRTKTRLVPFLNYEEAAQLYQALLLDTVASVSELRHEADLAVAITPVQAKAYFEGLVPAGALIYPVDGVDIGACLKQALGWLLEQGYRKAIALASDGPSLPVSVLQQAIAALEKADLILGPSEDGGYYLVGMKQLYGEIFDSIAWSTEQVLSQTIERAAQSKLQVKLTQPWYDVDTPADLLRLQAEALSACGENLLHTRAILSLLNLETRIR
jgi:uncharacterized protein